MFHLCCTQKAFHCMLISNISLLCSARNSNTWWIIRLFLFQYQSKAVPLHVIEAFVGERMHSSYSFLTLALDGVISVTSRPRCRPPGKGPKVPLDRRLGGAQSRSGHRGYRKSLLPLPGIEPRQPERPDFNIKTSGMLYVSICKML
jgi:hypothetical protein